MPSSPLLESQTKMAPVFVGGIVREKLRSQRNYQFRRKQKQSVGQNVTNIATEFVHGVKR